MRFRRFMILCYGIVFPWSNFLLASGGPLDLPIMSCPTAKEQKTQGNIVFRLIEAYSSEIQGEALVYRDATKRDELLTSMPNCLEVTAVRIEPKLSEGLNVRIVCGVWSGQNEGKGSMSANSSGYLSALVQEGSSSTAQLLRRKGDGWELIFRTLSCSEATKLLSR